MILGEVRVAQWGQEVLQGEQVHEARHRADHPGPQQNRGSVLQG